MLVELWADLLCPWCGLTNYRVNRTVETFAHRDQVEVVHRSYRLDPPATVTTVRDYLATKFGANIEQGVVAARGIEAMAAREGLHPYRVVDNQVGSTAIAHELLAYASTLGKNSQAWDLLFDAYFGHAAPIFTIADLLPLAEQLGLDRAETDHVLGTGRFRDQVSADINAAAQLGARGVPFLRVDGHYTIPGAVDTAALLTVLTDAYTHNQPAPTAEAAACGPDGCAIPADHAAHRS